LAVQILCVIPARLGATRLSHKPLRLLAGEPLVRRVARRALALHVANRVVVAADDARVIDAVAGLTVDAVLTDSRHRCGTDRVAEVASRPEYRGFDVVLSIQADQPFLRREAATGALSRVEGGEALGTAGGQLERGDLMDLHRVKVVVDGKGRALRFSRELPASMAWSCGIAVLHHIGVYAFRRSLLHRWLKWGPSPDELSEGLEQLRAMHHRVAIGVAVLEGPVRPAIDTERDLAEAEAFMGTLTARTV
jgi:3-deoxy-manno-octulosonate cytidylyltransferase (CMP-KDO synthetase)